MLVAWLMAGAAARRLESRGGHYRVDFPTPDPAWRARQAVDRRGWWRPPAPRPSDTMARMQRYLGFWFTDGGFDPA